jgi:hypothetical protein
MLNSTRTRAARIAAIVAGAQTRAALGQSAQYELLPDGRHKVSIYTGGRLLVGIGAMVGEAIAKIMEEPRG